MSFPSLHQSNSQFARFSATSLLLLQATIATTAMGAIVSTQPNWVGSQQASAQERPGTVSTSARDLGGIVLVSCLQAEDAGVRPEHCQSYGGALQGSFSPESLRQAEQIINDSVHSEIKLQQAQNPTGSLASFSFHNLQPAQNPSVRLFSFSF